MTALSILRFPSPGVDTRFPEPGVDLRFFEAGVDARFLSPGVDGEYQGEATPYADFIPGSAVDLMFDRGRYRLNGLSVPLPTIDGYHSRASNSWGQNAQGIWQEFPTGQMEVFPGLGYDGREGHTNLFSFPTGTLGLASSRVTNQGGLTGPVSNDAVLSTCTGQLDPLLNRIGPAPSAKTFTFSFFAKVVDTQGANPVARLYAYGSEGVEQVRERTITLTSEWQRFEWTVTFPAGMASTTSTWRIDPFDGSPNGVNQPPAGASIMTDGWQVVDRPYQVPFGVGTVAGDTLVIPAAAAGMAINPSVTGVTMFWRGTDFQALAAFPQMADARLTNNSRLTFYRNTSTGNPGVTLFNGTGTEVTAPLSLVPRATEFTMLATWRADGTRWVKIGSTAAQTPSSQTPFNGSISALGIGNGAFLGSVANIIHRRAGFLPYALSDADALALFNRINQGL